MPIDYHEDGWAVHDCPDYLDPLADSPFDFRAERPNSYARAQAVVP